MAVDSLHHTGRAVQHVVEQASAHAARGRDDIPELANLMSLFHPWQHQHPVIAWLHHWENLAFSLIVGLLLSAVAWRYGRKPAVIPTGGQNLLEMFVEGVDRFVHSILGSAGRQHTPFLGTLFLYIWVMNLSGLVPFLKSPTANINTTAGLALVVFCYVQWMGIRSNGPLGYLGHLAGSPRDVIGWALSPLMFVLHLIGELVRPVSLALRLCFNIFAEDIFLAVLVTMGISLGILLHLPGWIPIPLQFLVSPLILIFSTVQALVFSLLSSVYIALMLPHGHGEHHERI